MTSGCVASYAATSKPPARCRKNVAAGHLPAPAVILLVDERLVEANLFLPEAQHQIAVAIDLAPVRSGEVQRDDAGIPRRVR